ncbi:PREDICTED: leucine-rich repeat-containing protein 4B-like [Polistes canadensis]|uniref:leucine-rich repeat-containing protein 4B-like n=1 Tax=Polistes canadensis TaxID=91411 RepID=UPI000718D005|nr:PREDICTED: leucine-rich repeat-containing protein 4B-like [Polistes canadensis]
MPRGSLLILLIMMSATTRLVSPDKCAEECTCKWKNGKRTVECINRDLTSIPERIDPETQVLDMSGNHVRSLPSNIFVRVRLTNLQRLYLRECRIDRIDSEALTGLTNLVELDLSNNLLSGVPSASFSNTPFLRDLVLAYNHLERIHSLAFKNTPNLVKLDLSHTKLIEIEAKGFRGLESLESLKLNNNELATLHPGTFDPLNKLTSIELHDNPWICDCRLREMKMWLVKHNLPTLVAPICHGPEQLVDRVFTDLVIDDFACRPVLLIASHYAEATIGENASIVCRVSAIPPAKVKWYWNGRLLTNHSAFSSYQKVLIFEEGQFRKRSTLVLTNAQEADSSEFYCVAENRAGSVEANFTLHVSLRTAGMSTLGSGQIAGISAALVGLILFILLIILVLFIRLRRMPLKDVKSQTPVETVSGEGNGEMINSTENPSTTSSLARRKREEIETTSFGIDTKPPVSLNLSYVQRPQTALVQNESDYSTLTRYDDRQGGVGGCGVGVVGSGGSGSGGGGLIVGGGGRSSLIVAPGGGCFSSTTSLMPIDNPDLIRDTRRGSTEDLTPYGVAGGGAGDYVGSGVGRMELVDDGKILYSSCLWDSNNSTRDNTTTTTTTITSNNSCRDGCRDNCRGTSLQVNSYTTSSKETLAVVAPTLEQFPPGAKQMRVWQKGVPVLPPVSALKRVLGSTRSSPDEGYQEGTGTDV